MLTIPSTVIVLASRTPSARNLVASPMPGFSHAGTVPINFETVSPGTSSCTDSHLGQRLRNAEKGFSTSITRTTTLHALRCLPPPGMQVLSHAKTGYATLADLSRNWWLRPSLRDLWGTQGGFKVIWVKVVYHIARTASRQCHRSRPVRGGAPVWTTGVKEKEVKEKKDIRKDGSNNVNNSSVATLCLEGSVPALL